MSLTSLINFINKIIKHNRDREGDFGVRMLLHIPIGLVMSVPILGWGLVYLFKFYERNEDAHTEDQAWKDVFGAMVGFVIGLFCQLAYLTYWLLQLHTP
jgi:hypothetical protein